LRAEKHGMIAGFSGNGRAMRFQDQVAIVTGSASGIGLATAIRLASEGAKVVLADRDGARLLDACNQVRAIGQNELISSVCNVADENDVMRTVAAAAGQFGRLDIVVNNAGLMSFKPIEEQTANDWESILRVDLLGAFFFIKHAFRQMKHGGAIVNVSSIHAIETEPMIAPYAAAKTALLSLTRSAALEGKPKGIRINAVLPGAIDTPMLWDNPNVRSGIERIDARDVGKPEDVAAAIAFLASPEAAFIQGTTLRVNGGRINRL
jgi:NAD(P)-dependent dehydrogenase (short-subunit alcohol dehydrogenase family)